MGWLKDRLSEPSTHAALAGVAASLVPLVPSPWGGVAVAIFAALGLAVGEKR